MRVLFITHSYPREPGDAAGSFLLHLAVALRGEGVDVRVVAPSGDLLPSGAELPPVDVFDGIRVDRFRYAPRRYENLAYTGEMAQSVQRSWSAKLALVGFLGSEFTSATRVRREFEPDLIHAHWWFPGGLVGASAAALAGIPLVTTMHGTDVRLARAKTFARPLFRHVLGQSKAVTTVSSWLAREVTAMLPSVAPVVAPMPVSVDLFAPGTSRASDRILFVGRLNAQKGIDRLLDAMARMRHRVTLDVVGDGPDRADLRQRAAALGIADRIVWHGAVPQPAVAAFYRNATALVVPSIGEGLGLVAVEAQLSETPVVAFASGGVVDIIADQETGILVPPNDVGALADAMDRLVGDTTLQRAMGKAGRMTALAAFDPNSVARRYAGIYRGALAP
jgi:glycosyltransferase involved in cell wall biosynthesis